MFNFTTQTVYNSITVATAEQVKSGEVKNANVITSDGPKPAVRIGNTRFDVDDILDVQVKMPTPEALASVEFDMTSLVIAQDSDVTELTARVVLYIGLSMNSQDSLYANDLVYKGKPLFIEFPVKKGDDKDAIAKRVVAIAKKYFLFTFQDKILNVTAGEGANEGKVKFEGVNGYQQIKKAVLQKFDPEAVSIDCCANKGEFVDVVVGVPVIYSFVSGEVVPTETKLNADGEAESLDEDSEVAILPGLEAFGDYNWIIHNLRLPTLANTNFWSPTNRAGEMPVPGATYVQIIVRICKQRDGIMGEIVGARGTSVTTHVLYVNSAFYDTLMTAIGSLISDKVLTDADNKLDHPFEDADSTASV